MFIRQYHHPRQMEILISKDSESASWALLSTKVTSFWAWHDTWQWLLPSNPHAVCLVTFGDQNNHSCSLQFDTTCSMIFWLWNYQWRVLLFLTSFVLLTLFCALTDFGYPVPWWETFNWYSWRSCFYELGLLSFQMPKAPCCTCSAFWKEVSMAGWAAPCFSNYFLLRQALPHLVVWSAFCSSEILPHPFW